MLDPNIIIGSILDAISDTVNLIISGIPWRVWLSIVLAVGVNLLARKCPKIVDSSDEGRDPIVSNESIAENIANPS